MKPKPTYALAPGKGLGDSLMKKDQVAEKIACSIRHVERLAAAGRLTRVKIGRAVRFRFSEVSKLIQGGAA